jgi:hypothetical protein
LLRIADLRHAFAARREQLVKQRQWLIDLDHIFDPTPPPTSAAEVASQVDRYLADLLATTDATGDDFDRQVATHITTTLRNRWWGLFACYQVEGLPRTNNELETFLRRLKTNQRRITGRKNMHDFIVRYGQYTAFLDDRESQDDLLARLRQVPLADFQRERAGLELIQDQARKRHQFRHRQQVFLADLETRWATACAKVVANS